MLSPLFCGESRPGVRERRRLPPIRRAAVECRKRAVQEEAAASISVMSCRGTGPVALRGRRRVTSSGASGCAIMKEAERRMAQNWPQTSCGKQADGWCSRRQLIHLCDEDRIVRGQVLIARCVQDPLRLPHQRENVRVENLWHVGRGGCRSILSRAALRVLRRRASDGTGRRAAL
jgi:hypothetical protein